MIDAMSRTIKNMIFKYFTDEDTSNWIDILEDLTEAYNSTPNTALLGLTPNKAKDNIDVIQQINKDKNIRKYEHKFKVGQMVRVKLKKAIFTKGYKQIWSSKVYKIIKIQGVNAELDNEDMAKLNDLQIVHEQSTSVDEVTEVKKTETKAKVDRKLKSVGILEANETQEKRTRKPRTILDL